MKVYNTAFVSEAITYLETEVNVYTIEGVS